MKQYGYVRISSKDQNPERQILALQERQIKPSNIYLDRISGQDFSRPEYIKLLKVLKKGDVLIVKSIDRFDKLYAFIVKKASSDIEDKVLVEELFKLCKENFAKELIPKEISVISKFPIKSSGKRDMEAICDMAMKMEGNCK